MASVSVFSVLMRMHQPPSWDLVMFSHRRARMSLMRSPVRQLKSDAFLRSGVSHGVAARVRSSSSVRYSLRPSV